LTSETLEAKAVRLLASGRLCVLYVCAERIEARVLGSEGSYAAGYQHGAWWCSCPAARSGRQCPCLAALRRVTVRAAPAVDTWRAGAARTA
jgi:hypothetical protein